MNNHMTLKEAKELVKKVRESGCFIDEYCKRMGIKRKRYYNAVYKLEKAGINVDKEYPKAPRISEDMRHLVNAVDGKTDIVINRKTNGSTIIRIPADIDTDVLLTILDALGITPGETGIEMV